MSQPATRRAPGCEARVRRLALRCSGMSHAVTHPGPWDARLRSLASSCMEMSQRVTRASAVEDVGVVWLSAVALRVSPVLAPAERLEWLVGARSKRPKANPRSGCRVYVRVGEVGDDFGVFRDGWGVGVWVRGRGIHH
jgi:hypothetical protein